MKKLTDASAEAMEMQLARDMKNMRTYTVQASPVCVPIKFNAYSNILNLLVNAQNDYCQTVIEGNRRHNRDVSPYIARKMRDD